MKFLVNFSSDWADEFDVDGWWICNSDELDSFLTKNEKLRYPREYYFGTNEAFEFNSYKDYYNCLTITELTDREAATLEKHLSACFGTFIDPSAYSDWDDEEEL